MKTPKCRKLKSGNYNCTLRLNGENISITRATPTECKLAAELIKAEHRNNKRQKRVNMTIGNAMDKYINSRRKVLSPSTINSYLSIRNNRFKDYIDKKPSDIHNWQEVINAEITDNISPKTIKNACSLLRASLEYVGYDLPDIKLPKIIQSNKAWLDTDQVKVFIKAVHGHPVEIPALLALCSLRRSEILGLTWERIDLKNNLIYIEGSSVIGEGNKLVFKETNKTRKSRRIIPILIPSLKDALNAVPEDQRIGFVYTKTPTLIWEQINLICRKNNLPECGVHGLRHSFCSIAFSSEVGMTEREVMEIGGWENYQTVHNIYEHLSDKNRKEAEKKLAKFFQNAYKNVYETEKAP